MLAAGKSVEPYWNIYRQHTNSTTAGNLLEEMRIGTLHQDDVIAAEKERQSKVKEGDPYALDPIVSPVLSVLQLQPLNCEPPGNLLRQSYLTPNSLFFIRNHHPVPVVSAENVNKDYKIKISLGSDSKDTELTLQDIKTLFPKKKVWPFLI